MARTLIVLPDDSSRPILNAIDGARRSIRIKMFVFSDPTLLHATIAAKQRGVKVRVMLNAERRSGERDNEATRKALLRAGIDVKDANPRSISRMRINGRRREVAFVKSLNWTTKNLTRHETTRSSPNASATSPRWSTASSRLAPRRAFLRASKAI
jgi:Phosphatidylserine/phosphatidylglycerophosphate/cardiolipin synthases and related enzymes